MFLFHELLSHAELLKRKTPVVGPEGEASEARRATRRQRCGQVTLYPVVVRHEPVDPLEEEPRVSAAFSNVSSSGVGLVHTELLPEGLEFDIRWDINGELHPSRLQVVHCRPTTAGMYRTGARLLSGVLPEEPELRVIADPVEALIDVESTTIEPSSQLMVATEEPVVVQVDSSEAAGSNDHLLPGVLRFEPVPAQPPLDASPAPAGTFKMSAAFGFDKTERLDGVTTCGFERSIEMRRDGERLYLYIHSPGKKNGWGIYVDPNEFEAALSRVQDSAKSPFVTTLAA